MSNIGSIESSLHIPARAAPQKDNQSCFRGMIIRLQKFGKAMDSFLVGADPHAKGAVRLAAQHAQDRAHSACPPLQSPPMSWSMLSPKRRNAGERLLSKIPRAVNRICRSHGRRPVLTEHGCAIREDFKTIVLECLYKERHRQHASQSHGPLSADEVSLLIAKCDDLYARDFPAMVESLLRKFVREKNRTISSVLADAHRQLFEKAVTAMKPELAGRNRDETACRKIMWKLFDNANALAAPFLKNLDESSRAPKEYPKLTAYGCAFRDRFCAAAIALRHEAQADALAKSEAGKAAAMKAASPLTTNFIPLFSAKKSTHCLANMYGGQKSGRLKSSSGLPIGRHSEMPSRQSTHTV